MKGRSPSINSIGQRPMNETRAAAGFLTPFGMTTHAVRVKRCSAAAQPPLNAPLLPAMRPSSRTQRSGVRELHQLTINN